MKKKQNQKNSKKLKLMPSLREKRHYLVFKFKAKNKTAKQIQELIEKSILEFMGVLGYASARPIFIEITKEHAIVSVTTKYVDKVKASAVLIHEPNFSIKCVGVSGTIKKSRRFL